MIKFNINRRALAVIALLSLISSIISCGKQDVAQKAEDLLKTDTLYVVDTMTIHDTVTVTKNVNVGDYNDIYVVAEEIIKEQLTGELHLYSDFKTTEIEKTGSDTYKINMIVLWHNGEAPLISDVAMNLKYFGGNMKDRDNWVMTWFGQVPRCVFTGPCS